MKEFNVEKGEKDLDVIMECVVEKMKRIRKAENANQTELGYLMDSDKSVVSKIESGRIKKVSLFTLIRIAQVLEMDVHTLIKPCDTCVL